MDTKLRKVLFLCLLTLASAGIFLIVDRISVVQQNDHGALILILGLSLVLLARKYVRPRH